MGLILGGWGNLSPSFPLQSVTFRKTRRRVRRLRRKEKPLRADDLLPLAPGDTRGDFGSRWVPRGGAGATHGCWGGVLGCWGVF